MRHTPEISVIIPAYNYANYVGIAVNSVLEQIPPASEIIVVDDGSSDNTQEVLQAFGSKIRVITKRNAGLSAARNTGIEAAQSEWVAFLDADDKYLPGHLSIMHELIAERGHEYGLFASGAIFVDVDGREIRRSKNGSREVLTEDILVKTRFQPSSVVANRSIVLAAGGFDTELKASEDRDLWLRMSFRTSVWQSGTHSVHILRHPSNMSKNGKRQSASIHRVLTKAWDQEMVSHRLIWTWAEARAYYHHQSSLILEGNGLRWSAIRHTLLSLVWCPWIRWQHWDLNESYFFRCRQLLKLVLKGNLHG